MLPIGYFSNDETPRDELGTLGPSPISMETCNPFPKAPEDDVLQNYLTNFSETHSMLHLQMEWLLDKIKVDVSKVNLKRGMGIPESVVTLIFHMSDLLEISENCKYKACEIHDSFMIQMNADILRVVNRTQLDAYKMSLLDMRAQDLALLRIGSCIQLASKTYSYGRTHRHVTVTELRGLLRMLDCKVSDEVIKTSEMRVFALLNYNLNFVTALDLIELILIQIGLSQIDYRKIYSVVVNTLDHLYLKRQEILKEVYVITKARNPIIHFDSLRFRATTDCNKLIEGAAVVITALEILGMGHHPMFKRVEDLIAEKVDFQLVITLSIAIINSSRKDEIDENLDPGLANPSDVTTHPTFDISPSTSRST